MRNDKTYFLLNVILIFKKSTKKSMTKMKIIAPLNFQHWDCLVKLAVQLEQAHWQR